METKKVGKTALVNQKCLVRYALVVMYAVAAVIVYVDVNIWRP